jgi:tellurite resistance protein
MTDFDIILRMPGEQNVNIDNLFGDYRKAKQTDWTIPQAFVCLLVAAAMVDEKLTAEEQSEIEALFKRSRTLKLIQKDLMMAKQVAVSRLKDRPNAVQEACETLPDDMRVPVFAHCLDIILSDGDFVEKEKEFLKKVVGFFGLDPVKVQDVTKVLFLKNQY